MYNIYIWEGKNSLIIIKIKTKDYCVYPLKSYWAEEPSTKIFIATNYGISCGENNNYINKNNNN